MTVMAASPRAIAEGAAILKRGGLVAFPTETVYGLGADATNGLAVARVFAAKGRPAFNPLIVHVASISLARNFGHFGPVAEQLAAAFWPGPLTLVVPLCRQSGICDLAVAGLDSIGLRIPNHRIALALVEAAGLPICAPSANRSGHVSPTLADHVASDLGAEVELVIDGGAASIGIELTVIDARGAGPVILRPGAVTQGDIERITGMQLANRHGDGTALISPGQLLSHYAPSLPVRLDANFVTPNEALLSFGSQSLRIGGPQINLSRSGNLHEAAANLYASLRALDRPGLQGIAVMPIPNIGIGVAINDKLRRAAHR